jgi:hypothetical protein
MVKKSCLVSFEAISHEKVCEFCLEPEAFAIILNDVADKTHFNNKSFFTRKFINNYVTMRLLSVCFERCYLWRTCRMIRTWKNEESHGSGYRIMR